ncbi:hypothetical protein RIF29_38336 [Crotalaria pallida]|uniref:Uncharacterized protein n=1 Tax=Crotalaria pallida TaxID=3830 RepID=A0AAN9E0Z6_CROPI
MAKKRGRPPKYPSPLSQRKTPNVSKAVDRDDLEDFDEEDMEILRNLTPKKFNLMMQKLAAMRDKMKEKAVVEDLNAKQTDHVVHDTLIRNGATNPNIGATGATSVNNEASKENPVDIDDLPDKVPETQALVQQNSEPSSSQIANKDVQGTIPNLILNSEDVNQDEEGQWTPAKTRTRNQKRIDAMKGVNPSMQPHG